MAEFLRGMLGGVENLDAGHCGDFVGKFLHVRVSIDISKPFKPGLLVPFHIDDDDRVLPVVYERLLDFCYFCRSGDHYFRIVLPIT